MPPSIAQIALTALGFCADPVHEPVHGGSRHIWLLLMCRRQWHRCTLPTGRDRYPVLGHGVYRELLTGCGTALPGGCGRGRCRAGARVCCGGETGGRGGRCCWRRLAGVLVAYRRAAGVPGGELVRGGGRAGGVGV